MGLFQGEHETVEAMAGQLATKVAAATTPSHLRMLLRPTSRSHSVDQRTRGSFSFLTDFLRKDTAFRLCSHGLPSLRHCLTPVFSLPFFAKTLPFASVLTAFLR